MLRIFEYIRFPNLLYLYLNIRYSAKNIRIFEYIQIFATLCKGQVLGLVLRLGKTWQDLARLGKTWIDLARLG